MDKKRHQYLMHLDKYPHRMETNRQERKKQQNIRKNLNIAEEAIQELHLTKIEAIQLNYLIKNTPNLKQFHKQASNKRIIYGLGITKRQQRRPNTKFKRLDASWDNKIDIYFLDVIKTNLLNYTEQYTPFCCVTTDYDHDLLSRNGGKI